MPEALDYDDAKLVALHSLLRPYERGTLITSFVACAAVITGGASTLGVLGAITGVFLASSEMGMRMSDVRQDEYIELDKFIEANWKRIHDAPAFQECLKKHQENAGTQRSVYPTVKWTDWPLELRCDICLSAMKTAFKTSFPVRAAQRLHGLFSKPKP